MTLFELIQHRPLRVHGNGFIQCDIDSMHRLHFWGHYRIPKQAQPTHIHDHVFGFESLILKGQIVNVILQECDGIEYKVYTAEAREGQDTGLVESGSMCNLYASSVKAYSKGDTYRMTPGQIHDIHIYSPSITIIRKSKEFLGASGGARVFARWGVYPDNEFRRDAFEQEWLREIVMEIAETDMRIL